MISDRDISATMVTSVALWILGGACVILGVLVDTKFNGLGLYLTGAAMVFSVRCMFCKQTQREINAFELGRDSADVRSLR